jgi:hypothetical protein
MNDRDRATIEDMNEIAYLLHQKGKELEAILAINKAVKRHEEEKEEDHVRRNCNV